MKDKILEALKNRYSNLGLSKDVLGGFAEYLSSKITEETGIEDAITAIEPLLKIQQKEFDKIRAARKKEESESSPKAKDDEVAKKEQETEKPKPEPKPQPQPQPQPEQKKSEEMPEYVKKLLAEVDSLKKRAAAEDKAKVMATRKSEMSKIVSKLPESIKKAYERMNLDVSDEDFDQLKTTVEEEVRGMEKDLTAKKTLFSPPFKGDAEPSQKLSPEKAKEYAKVLLNN